VRISLFERDQLVGPLGVVGATFDSLLAQIRGRWNIEHDPSGTHTKVNASQYVSVGTQFFLKGYVTDFPTGATLNDDQWHRDPSTSAVVMISPTSNLTLTGIPVADQVMVPGQILMLINISTFTITAKHNDSASSARHRLYTPNSLDMSIPPSGGALVWYDQDISRWRMLPFVSGTLVGANTGDQLVFKTIAVSGQSDVVADSTADTLTFVAGTGITITTNAAGDSITITASAGSGTVTHTAGALTASAVVVGNGSDDVKVLASLGTTTTVLHGNVAGLPSFSAVDLAADVTGALPTTKLGAGAVVQVVNTQTGNVATGSTQIPTDNTIPQNTEGDEYMTLAITPKSATNKLRIDVVCNVTNATAARYMTAALFQDSAADALASNTAFVVTAASGYPIVITFYMTAGTTSSTTFKVRAGANGTGTTSFNGSGGVRIQGGVMYSSITITEIAA